MSYWICQLSGWGLLTLVKIFATVEVAVAKGETQAVSELAQVPGRELGMVDPARMTETIDVVKSVFTLKNPVSVGDVYAPGFVGKGS